MPVRIVAIGNPGTGKSTILNCHARQALFKSATTRGRACTQTLEKRVSANGNHYWDTIGIDDPSLKERACEDLNEFLSMSTPDQPFKIIFVLVLQAGRWRNDDIATVKLVTDACKGQIKGDDYGVIVNNCDAELMTDLATDPSARQEMLEAWYDTTPGIPKTQFIHFEAHRPELHRKNTVVVPLQPQLQEFIDNLPLIAIDNTRVQPISVDQMEQVKLLIAVLQQQLQEDRERRAQEKAQREAEAARQAKLRIDGKWLCVSGKDVGSELHVAGTSVNEVYSRNSVVGMSFVSKGPSFVVAKSAWGNVWTFQVNEDGTMSGVRGDQTGAKYKRM